MIGQQRLQYQIERLVEIGFPPFVLLSGVSEIGRKELIELISKKLSGRLVYSEISVDAIRETISQAYQQGETTIFAIHNADKMSIGAKNALLKITEEPPRNAYFILSVKDEMNTLTTLRSRGTGLKLLPYSQEELISYIDQKQLPISSEERRILTLLSETPDDVELLSTYKLVELYEFIVKVARNLHLVSGANALKIAQNLKFKEDDQKEWHVSVFLRLIMYVYQRDLIDFPIKLRRESIAITSKYLSQLEISGINKIATFDMWILDIRNIWLDYADST